VTLATSIPAPAPTKAALPLGKQLLLAVACGLLVANIYYAQPLTGLIGPTLGLTAKAWGLLVTLPLLGYGLGLLLVVPLADRVENRRLVVGLVLVVALAALLLSLTTMAAPYLALAFLLGMTSSTVQVLVPYVTYLAPEAERGVAVGRVVSGVMLGIMLARPVSSLLADLTSWRMVFRVSAVAMIGLAGLLATALPPRRPPPGLTYRQLLGSMAGIFVTTEILRRRALYQAAMFGAFSVFWTAAPLWLSGPHFHLGQRAIAWVALAGVAGAVAPPIASRLADRGLTVPATALAMTLAAAAFPLTLIGDSARLQLGFLVAAAVVLDFAVSANLVLGQRAIYALSVEQRSRINGLFMATLFAGGAVSSALGGWTFARFGWNGVCVLGAILPVMAGLYFATEARVAR
jgi:predicted MFS family arabinose efflux permease